MTQVIVMAAGLGSRLKDLTKVTPKPLLRVNNQPILEHNIEYMIDAGIDRVVLIVGYLKEQFFYLKEKYKDQIDIDYVINDQYAEYNTVRSMWCAIPYFTEDSFITTADNYLQTNLYKKYKSSESFYLLRPYQHFDKEEWTVDLDDHLTFLSVNLHGHDGYAYSGVSFWKKKDLAFIHSLLDKVDWNASETKKMYWDNVLLPHLSEFPIHAKILQDNRELYEIDDKEDLEILKREIKECM